MVDNPARQLHLGLAEEISLAAIDDIPAHYNTVVFGPLKTERRALDAIGRPVGENPELHALYTQLRFSCPDRFEDEVRIIQQVLP